MTNGQSQNAKNPMNDEDEEEQIEQTSQTILRRQSQSLALRDNEATDENEEEVYFTNDGYDPTSPRGDFFDRSPVVSAREPPKLVHTNTILRLCPEIESVTTTYAISAAGSMKIASKLFHYISDARKTLSQSASFQVEKPIEEETVSTTNLSSPSVMKWLRKVSYLVTALSSMESSSDISVQTPPSPHPPPQKYDSLLCQITEKAKTPLDLKLKPDMPLPKNKSRYHLDGDSPEPLIQLFTLNPLPTVHKQKLFSKASTPSIPRSKHKGPYVIKSTPEQMKGYKIDPAEIGNFPSPYQSTELDRELDAKAILKGRKNLPTSTRKGKGAQRNNPHKVENGSQVAGSVTHEHQGPGKKSPKLSLTDSLQSSEGEEEIDPKAGNSRRGRHRRGAPRTKRSIKSDEGDSDSELMFIHDWNPAQNEIDCFEEEFEFYSSTGRHSDKDSEITVTKLHSHSRSMDQQDFISVEIKSTSCSSSIISQHQSLVDLTGSISNSHDIQRPSTSPDDRRSSSPFQRNNFAVVDTRHFSHDNAQATISPRRLQLAVSQLNLDSNANPIEHQLSKERANSPIQRPTTTGSIAMDQFYTKQYYDHLTENLLTNSLVTAVQPNHLELPTHRSHSAQRYRKLRSPFLTDSKTKKSTHSTSSSYSSPTYLPSAVKPSVRGNQQAEKIFLHSGRRQSPSNKSSRANSPHALDHRLLSAGEGSKSHTNRVAHYMEGIGHLRPETYDGVQRSLQIVTYFTEDNYH
jgi:hypothetical protein